MAEEEDKEILTTGQITFLAEAITPQNLKTIAMGYLDIDDTRITMEEYQHRLNVPAFKREIIKIWKYKNSSGNQVKVSPYFILLADHAIEAVKSRDVVLKTFLGGCTLAMCTHFPPNTFSRCSNAFSNLFF